VPHGPIVVIGVAVGARVRGGHVGTEMRRWFDDAARVAGDLPAGCRASAGGHEARSTRELELSTGGDLKVNQGRNRRMSAGCSETGLETMGPRIVTSWCRNQSAGPSRTLPEHPVGEVRSSRFDQRRERARLRGYAQDDRLGTDLSFRLLPHGWKASVAGLVTGSLVKSVVGVLHRVRGGRGGESMPACPSAMPERRRTVQRRGMGCSDGVRSARPMQGFVGHGSIRRRSASGSPRREDSAGPFEVKGSSGVDEGSGWSGRGHAGAPLPRRDHRRIR